MNDLKVNQKLGRKMAVPRVLNIEGSIDLREVCDNWNEACLIIKKRKIFNCNVL